MASVVIGFNWGGFIWGVNNGRVVEVSLGYFINPLVTVLLGVLVLGERLRRSSGWRSASPRIAVVGLTVDYGHPPWVALLLAGSFGTYGLAKKKAGGRGDREPDLRDTAARADRVGLHHVAPVHGDSNFSGHGVGHSLLLASTGLVTAIPLICFGAAAIRVSMTTIGLLQYLAPTIQFALGLVVFHEEMTPVKWFGFALVWLALVIFTAEALRHRSGSCQLAAEASAV